MTDLDAAFNLAQFYKSNAFIERRQEIAKLYIENLEGVKHVTVPTFNEDHLFTQFIVKISKNRDGFARELKKGDFNGTYLYSTSPFDILQTKVWAKI